MADSADLLEIPDFLKRETRSGSARRTRRKKTRETQFRPGVQEKRPTRAQYATLTKRDWAATQVVKLSRDEAAAIIKLGVGPEARFTKDKKHQFPDKTDE